MSLEDLFLGEAHLFADWAKETNKVPPVSAGVYTVWDGERFLYVGMAGKNLTAEHIESPDEPVKAKGLRQRLKSHADGRRSGDQFCVYICDRFVVPTLSTSQRNQVGEGTLLLDDETKKYIHKRLSYRFLRTRDGKDALKLETEIQLGNIAPLGQPFLNPKNPKRKKSTKKK